MPYARGSEGLGSEESKMRLAWLGMVSCALVGASSVTACGAAFSEATDGGSGDPDGAGADGADDGSLLEGSPGDAMPMNDATAHADAARDGGDGAITMDGTTGIDSGADAATGMDSTTGMDSAIPDSQPDSIVLDACTTATATDGAGTFVQQGGSGSLCTKAAPCGSITTAIGALSGRSTVFVAQGTYVEQITLASNVLLQGGWVPGAWTRNCGGTNATATIIQAPANANKTIIASSVTNTTLDTLTIKSKDQGNVGVGESLYGIFASGGSLSLLNVNVTMVSAGAGQDGVPASTVPAQAPNNCAFATGSTGVGAVGGANGAGAPAGSFSSGGYTPSDGTNGSQGASGQNGTQGTDANNLSQDGVFCTLVLQDGICEPTSTRTSTGTNGTLGCGGSPGAIGTAGHGGGSSVGVYAAGATITINGGAVAAGNGGKGGNGGAGGAGGAGGNAGNPGAGGPSVPTNCRASQPCSTSGIAPFVAGAAGGAGGPGGAGATGGSGGGGAGGSSYSYFFVSGGVVSPNGTTLTFGSAGAGGTGANAGATGSAAQHN